MGRGSNFGMMWCRDTVLKETFPVLFSIAHANLYCAGLGGGCLCFLCPGVALGHCEKR